MSPMTPSRRYPGSTRAHGTRADQTTVRRSNLAVVMRDVAATPTSSRATIARQTGLTRATVSSLVAELIELGLLCETDEGDAPPRVGRPAQQLRLGDAPVAVGLEVNVDYLAAVVEDLRGGLLHERRVFVDNRCSAPGRVLDRLAAMAREAIAVAEAAGRVPVGVAVALPGLVEVDSGTLLRAPNLDWSRLRVVDEMQARLPGLTLRVENESNLAALAEHWLGVAGGLGSFICVFGDVGVGSGIYVDGELYRGTHGFGGEVGHIVVAPDGPPCACGSRGCLESFVGQEAIARRAGLDVPSGERTQNLTAELVRRAELGDPAVVASLRTAGEVLGVGLSSAVNLFDLDAVVLGGCFGPLAPWLADEVRAALRARVLSAEWSACDVLPSAVGELAAVRGAAALILREVVASPWTVAGRLGRPFADTSSSSTSHRMRREEVRRSGSQTAVPAGAV